jgi:hypothetical protein
VTAPSSDLAAVFELVYGERGALPSSWICRVCGADVDSRSEHGTGLGEHLRRHLDR